MGKVLQTLTVNLEANTASFSQAMTKASQISLASAKSIQRSFQLVSTAAIAAGVAVAGAVAGIVVNATEYASSIEQMAQKTNMSTQELSKLAYATSLTGGNLEDLSGLLVKFSKNAVESAEGNAKSHKAFSTLGMSVTNTSGRFKSASDLFEQTTAKLNKMPDGMKKTELEMTLFGKSGAALAPILKVLGANAEQTASDMKAFGLSISPETAKGAQALAQTYERTKLALTGLGLTVFATALPALQALADKVISLAKDGSLQRWAATLGKDVSTAAQAASDALQFLSDHGSTLAHTLEALMALEIASWLLSINTKAITAAGGMDILVTSVGKAALKMTGLSGLVTAMSGAFASATAAIQVQAYMLTTLAAEEGIATAATYALSTAWKSLSGAILTNPIGIALGLATAGAYVFYRALTDDVAASAKLGDAAVTFADYWSAAIDQTKDRLGDLKTVLLTFNDQSRNEALNRLQNGPSFGQRVHQEANARAASTPKPVATPPPGSNDGDQPKPVAPVKPDPYKDEINKLNQELTNSQNALNAAMMASVDAQRQATEAGKAGLIITELQDKMKRQLSTTEKAAITSAIAGAGENEHNAQVVESLRQRTDAAKDALAQTRALSLVIGEGAAAEDAAKRSTGAATLARELGASASAKYGKAISDLLVTQAQAAQADRELATQNETQSLSIETADTLALAASTLEGSAAVERMTLMLKLQQAQREHAGDDAAITKHLTDEIIAQADAQAKLNASENVVFTSPLAQYQQSLQSIAKASNDAKKAGVDVDVTQVWMANREAALQYQSAVEKLDSVYGSASDGARDFFTDLKNQTLSAATMIHDVLSQAFSSLNDNLSKLLTGQKASFAEFFRSIGESVAKMGLQKAEQSIVGSITGGDKSKGAKSDPALGTTNSLLKTINASILSISGKGMGTIADSTTDKLVGAASSSSSGGFGSTISAMANSFLPGIGGIFGSIFGGHRALGGSVQAGMSYDVGEMGRETFTPSTNGTITPHNRTQGQFNTYITTANGTTPEQTKMMIQSALREAHPQLMAAAKHQQASNAARQPSSHR